MATVLQNPPEENAAPPGFEPLPSSPPDAASTAPPGFEPIGAPEGFEPVESETEQPGIGKRIVGRFFGTDVEDPLELPRLGTIITGGVAGSILGSRVPTLPGPAGLVVNPVVGAGVGGLAGVVTGAVSPETAMELGEFAGVVPEGTRDRIGLSPAELQTLTENEALLEVATFGGFSALRLAGRGTARLLTGSGRETAEAAARQDIHLMPVQVGNKQIGRGFVSVMGRFPFIGSSIRKTGEAAEKAAGEAFRGIPERIGPITSSSDVSERIFRDASTLVSETNKKFGERYTALFARADEVGARVVPTSTLAKADEILQKIAGETPVSATGEPLPAGPAIAKVREFIETSVLPLREATEAGTITAQQSFRQMDGLISKIDQEIASLEPSQRRFARALLTQLRQGAQYDVLMNVRGEGAEQIARGMKELDTEFSQTMSQIFETATAKRFGTVQRRGLRGVATDETTRTPVDQLARVVVNLDSPQSIDELSRLVTPDTFRRVTAQVMDDAISVSMRQEGGGIERFNVEKFAKHLGLDRTMGGRREVVARMLEKSGSPLKLQDLDDLVMTARSMSNLEIPNVSSFIARRGMLGGVQGIINGIMPGIAVAGGATYAGGPLIGIATLLGGGKLVSAILSNPTTARALSKVLDKEASQIVKRENTLRAVRGGLAVLRDSGAIDNAMFFKLNELAGDAVEALAVEIESLREGMNR